MNNLNHDKFKSWQKMSLLKIDFFRPVYEELFIWVEKIIWVEIFLLVAQVTALSTTEKILTQSNYIFSHQSISACKKTC